MALLEEPTLLPRDYTEETLKKALPTIAKAELLTCETWYVVSFHPETHKMVDFGVLGTSNTGEAVW
jgi:hypothetical protein